MKVYQLYENVSSSTELSNAFSSEEWMRIANYLIRNSNLSRWKNIGLGRNHYEIISSMRRINREIGADMFRQTPAQWNSQAAKYGMDYNGNGSLSWDTIYRHLAQHRDEPLPAELDIDTDTNVSSFNDTDNTQENKNDVSKWVQTTKNNWSDFESLSSDLLRPWMEKLYTKRSKEWVNWLNGKDANGNPNIFYSQLESIKERIVSTLSNQGEISKDQVISLLYGWLTSADMVWERFRNESS
jgi:hypothetical protein